VSRFLPNLFPGQATKTVDKADLNGFIAREIRTQKGGRFYKIIFVNRENREKSLYPGLSDRAQVEYIVDYLNFFYKTGESGKHN